jgi:hypothetical protein
MKINKNALDILADVMQHRNWYGSAYDRRTAATYKSLLNQGRLSYEKASEILNKIGWLKVEEETWQRA